jgi:uncharacterized protein YndB with AHSA1/START domain
MSRVPFAFVLSLTSCVRDTVPRVASARSIVLREEAAIAASPERVWELLTDLPRYAEWNPWLVHAEGTLAPGGIVWADVWLGAERRRAKHVVLAVEPRARLCWRDAGWTTAFVYGQRCRMLDARADGTVLLRQELLLEGPFVGTALRRYGDALRRGLAAETQALKQRAEQAPR